MMYFEMLSTDADVLLRETIEYTRQESLVTARLLVRLAAVEERELYAAASYPTMWDYCLGELGMSEDAAGRRLWAARKCREFPALFDALADGRFTLTAVHTLATYLRPETVDELIAAATGRSKSELKDWLACRFPRPAVPTCIEPVRPASGLGATPVDGTEPVVLLGPGSPAGDSQTPEVLASPAHANAHAVGHVANSHALARVPVPSSVSDPAISPVPLSRRAHVDPLNADEVMVSFTMPRRVLAKLQHAMDLLGHAIVPHDVAALLERLLDMGTPKLERQKFAATDHPRAPQRLPHSLEPARTPPLKAPHEDQLRATLTAWGHTVAEVSIGLSAALRLPPGAGYDSRLDAALEALRPRGAA